MTHRGITLDFSTTTDCFSSFYDLRYDFSRQPELSSQGYIFTRENILNSFTPIKNIQALGSSNLLALQQFHFQS